MRELFSVKPAVIGMLHLPPLAGSPRYAEKCPLDTVLADARAAGLNFAHAEHKNDADYNEDKHAGGDRGKGGPGDGEHRRRFAGKGKELVHGVWIQLSWFLRWIWRHVTSAVTNVG